MNILHCEKNITFMVDGEKKLLHLWLLHLWLIVYYIYGYYIYG